MKRIGKTDQGGILLEMTAEDLSRFQQAMDAFADLLVQGANHGLCVAVEEVMPPVTIVRTESAKGGATKSARAKKQARKYVKELKKTSKACEQCGKHFVPATVKSRLCSKACTDKDWRLRKLAGIKPTSETKCLGCGHPFTPHRKDQKCCSTKCRMSMNSKKAPEVKQPDAKAPARVVINDDVKAKRLEMMRKIIKKDAYVPPEARQASGSNLDDISEFRQAQREAVRE